MSTEIHDPMNVARKESEIKKIHKCIDYINSLINDDSLSLSEEDSYYLELSKAYLEEHTYYIKNRPEHSSTTRKKLDD